MKQGHKLYSALAGFAVVMVTIFTMIFAVGSVDAKAAGQPAFRYHILEDGTAEITGFDFDVDFDYSTLTTLTFPTTIDGYKVTSIGSYSFWGGLDYNTSVTKVVIPSGIEHIGVAAIASMNVKTISYPSSLKSIEGGALDGTGWYQQRVNAGTDIIVNGILLKGSEKASGAVTIPTGVTTISGYAYSSNENITSVTIPSTVKTIEYGAFMYCSNLSTISIPSSVTTFGTNAFYGTKWLENKRKSTPLIIINNVVVDGLTCTGAVTIPSTVTKIAPEAFGSSSYYDPGAAITSITIPSSVKEIGSGAFERCEKLTKVVIPNSVEKIESDAFRNCTNLSSVTLSKNLKSVGHNAFFNTKWLKDKEAKNMNVIVEGVLLSVTERDSYKNEMYVVPEGVTLVAGGSLSKPFYYASGIQFASSVKYIDKAAFGYNYGEPTVIESINYPAFYGGIGSVAEKYADYWNHEFYSRGKCGNGVYYVYTRETGEFYISGAGAMTDYQFSWNVPWFAGRERIKTVTVADGVTTIATNAFYNCINLKTVYGCKDVTNIGINTFRNCSSLVKVEGCTKAKQVEQYAFCGDPKLTTLGSTANVINLPACEKIGGYAFYECKAIKSLKTSSPLTYLGTRAFSNAIAMTTAQIGANCATIGSFSFCGCTSLTTVTGCAGVTGIGQSAFNSDAKLVSVQGLTKLTSVGHRAFQNCTALKTIGATSGAINLNAVVGIGDYAFSGCKAIVKFTAGANLKQIGTYAFQNNTAMTSLYLKTTKLATVGANALKGIKSTCVIYVPSAKVSSYKSGVLKSKGQASTVVIKAY